MTRSEVVVLSAARSAIGPFGGLVFNEAIARSGVDPEQDPFASVGNCIPNQVAA